MQLAALSYGYGVTPESIAGTVVGVFPAACVIESEDGNLVALVTAETGNLPGGIVVESPPTLTLPLKGGGDDMERERSSPSPQRGGGPGWGGISVGRQAVTVGGLLRFESGDLVIDIRPARPWRSDLDALGLNLGRESPQHAWRAAANLLATDGRAATFTRLAGSPIESLAEAVARFDYDSASATVRSLVGLGEGTTPAGDDFLVGFLGGLWASAATDPTRQGFAQQIGECAAVSADRTHRASRIYLMAAAVGEVSERLTRLVAAIASDSVVPTADAARASLDVGHSSGACGVLGLLHGSCAWDAPSLARSLREGTVTPEPLPPVPA